MTNFAGVDKVPLLGAIAGCHYRVPLQGARGKGNDQFWGSGRGAIAGCHIKVSLLGTFFL